MKRDWELIRDILARIEEQPKAQAKLGAVSFDDETRDVAAYHIGLLIDAGLVKGRYEIAEDGTQLFIANSLTWEGHELLDSIRSDTVWNTTKQKFTQAGVDMTFDLVKSTALKYAANALATL